MIRVSGAPFVIHTRLPHHCVDEVTFGGSLESFRKMGVLDARGTNPVRVETFSPIPQPLGRREELEMGFIRNGLDFTHHACVMRLHRAFELLGWEGFQAGGCIHVPGR